MKRKRVLLLGPTGPVGTAIRKTHAAHGSKHRAIDLLPVPRSRLDLTTPGALAQELDGCAFDALVNCSAHRRPDAAEQNPATAFALHAHAVRDMAALCEERNASFVHISADFVFGSDPLRSSPWRETDPAGPVNVLGASLALGETLAEQSCGDVTTVRVGALLGADECDVVGAIVRLARTPKRGGRRHVRAAPDEYVSPTRAADVASFVLRLLTDGAEPGRYHVVNGGAASLHGLAAAVVDRIGVNVAVVAERRGPAAVSRRPRYRVLDNLKAGAQFGALPPWQEALEAHLAALGEKGRPAVRRIRPQPRRWLAGVVLDENTPPKTPFLYGLGPRRARSHRDGRRRIETVGRNTGNLAFAHALDRHLGGGLKSLRLGSAARKVNLLGDIAVVPAANQLGEHLDYRRNAQLLCDVSVPIVVVGLGAQSSPDWRVPKLGKGSVDWVRQVAEHAPKEAVPNIGVRGSFTLYVLDRCGLREHAEVIGCPSFFLNPCPRLGERIAAKLRPPERVAVVAGNPYLRDLGKIEASLTELATTPGSYVVQAPPLLQLVGGDADGVAEEAIRACRDHARPALSPPEFVRWAERHGAAFFDVPKWIEHYRQFDAVVGTRIHGTVLGLMAGVPSLCVAHDSRTLELCQTLKVPHVLASEVAGGLTREELPALLRFDPAEFDDNRQRLCRSYVSFLRGNGLGVADWLARLGQLTEAGEAKEHLAEAAA